MAQNYVENCFDPNAAALSNMQTIEDNLHCLKTCFSGSSVPPDSTGFMLWGDSAAAALKIKSANNAEWLSLFDVSTTYNGAAYRVRRTVSAGSGLTGGGLLTSDVSLSIASGGVTETMIASSAVTAAKIANGAVTFPKLPAGAVMIYQWQPKTSSNGVGPSTEEYATIPVYTTPGTSFGFYLFKTSAMSSIAAYVRARVSSVIGYVRLYHPSIGASTPPGGINGGPFTAGSGALSISSLANDTIHWIQVQFYCNSGSGSYDLYSFQAFVTG